MMFFKRFAALAELLLVLAIGNLAGVFLFNQIVPASVAEGTASDVLVAFNDGLRILLRLGLACLAGFLLLYYRRGITPAQAGLRVGDRSLGDLLSVGVVMGLLAGFLVSLLFAVHSLLPFGSGLAAWWEYSDTEINLAFWITLLGTSVLIPPLTEEILVRGYFRTRLVEDYGVMSGVILTGLAFGLSHTRYLNGDSMLLMFMLIILINSVTWTYITQKTGSIIPALVAHALSNGIGTAVLFNVWVPFTMTLIAVALFAKPIAEQMKAFLRDCRHSGQWHSFWQGLAIILMLLVAGPIVLRNLIGGIYALMVLGGICLLVTVVNLYLERRQTD